MIDKQDILALKAAIWLFAGMMVGIAIANVFHRLDPATDKRR